VSLIEEGPSKHVRMANLAIVGSHSTNGVAAIHSELLRTDDGQRSGRDVFPERFNNKTNRGHAPTLVAACKPRVGSHDLRRPIGDGWIHETLKST